jgi:hypothetical protein
VRLVINYMKNPASISWSGGSASASNVSAIGRNLAFNSGIFGSGTSQASVAMSSNNMCVLDGYETTSVALPTELMLAAGQTFSATCGAYNIVVIPEAG